MIATTIGYWGDMFRHRRVRVVAVLLTGWAVLTAVERWAERAPWPSAVLAGLLWSCVVAGAWWFAEWTQLTRATAHREHDGFGRRENRSAESAAEARSGMPGRDHPG
ncbi:hypothetical protein CGZ69_35480 [Streptomyces peucetius subsp. caesius ATCC 27952]|nr:hypothetical protein CGZ69_35480 [Streptomyces peucetius subsp. caesius ATCC 27952]